MATGDTETTICSNALMMIGEDPINSAAPPQNVKRAILASQFYDPTRRAVLERAPWSSCKKFAALAAATGTPLFSYTSFFPLPTDFIRMFEWPEDGRPLWEIVTDPTNGRCIVSNQTAPLLITYVFDNQNPAQFDPLLTDAITFKLASRLAIPLTRDPNLKALMENAFEDLIATMAHATPKESLPDLEIGMLPPPGPRQLPGR